MRIPPSAGSASGVLPNPVGYNRVYVHTGENISWDAWWNGLRKGRSFVINGPLLICKVNGKPPEARFAAMAGESCELELDIVFYSADNIPTVEVVWNGSVVNAIPVSGKPAGGITAKIQVEGPGWLLISAITDCEETFRFASTAPWYLGRADLARSDSHISRKSAQFFLDWVDERIERVPQKLKDPAKLRAVLEHHEKARVFWQKRVAAATAP